VAAQPVRGRGDGDMATAGRNEDLIAAIADGDGVALERALRSGASVNANDGTGDVTPLIAAAMFGNLSAARLLLSRGVHINGRNCKGMTALMIAALNGHDHIVEALVAGGAQLDLADGSQFTALHGACYRGHQAVVKRLLDAGASRDVVDAGGNRPIDVVSGGREVACGQCAGSVVIATADRVSVYLCVVRVWGAPRRYAP